MSIERKERWQNGPFVQEFLQYHLMGREPATKKMYYRFLREFVEFCCDRWSCGPSDIDFSRCTIVWIGEHAIYQQIERKVITEYLSHKTSANLRKKSSTVLRAYFSYLLDKEIIQNNPVPEEPRKKPLPKQGLPIAEIESVVACIKKAPEPYRSGFIIQLSAGLRASEVLSLRTEDVFQGEDGKWVISVCREAMKGRKAWQLPLPDITEVMNSLMAWRAAQGIGSDYLLTYKDGRKIKFGSYWEKLKECTEEAQLGRSIGTHDLRRFYATLMDEYIDNPDVLIQAMRHSPDWLDSQRVTRGYVKEPPISEVAKWVYELPVVKLADALAAIWLETEQ